MLDSDIGTDVDDVVTLLLAVRESRYDLRLFVTANELDLKRYKMARHVLTTHCGRDDVAVLPGVDLAHPHHWYDDELMGENREEEEQRDGFNRLGSMSAEERIKAIVTHLQRLVDTAPSHRIRYVSIGGLSNLNGILQDEAGLDLFQHHVDLFIMGGCFFIQRPRPEFNIRLDVTASISAFRLLASHNILYHLVPLDVTAHPKLGVRLDSELFLSLQRCCPLLHSYMVRHIRGFTSFTSSPTFNLHDPLTLCAQEVCRTWKRVTFDMDDQGFQHLRPGGQCSCLVPDALTDSEAEAFVGYTTRAICQIGGE